MRTDALPAGVRIDRRGFYRFNCAICQAKKKIWYGGVPARPDLCMQCHDVVTADLRFPKRIKETIRDIVKRARAASKAGKPVRARILARRAKAAAMYYRKGQR